MPDAFYTLKLGHVRARAFRFHLACSDPVEPRCFVPRAPMPGAARLSPAAGEKKAHEGILCVSGRWDDVVSLFFFSPGVVVKGEWPGDGCLVWKEEKVRVPLRNYF